MRISFVGGGTDLPDFYKQYPGRVISTAIDKFVHIALNATPTVDKVSARYSVTETVNHPSELKHRLIKEILLDLNILKGIEIASFADLPVSTGMGSSSSFSVALIKALYAYQGKKINKYDIAEAACRLEIELAGEPIGKQDQYAAAFGGFNIFQFNADHSVEVKPILLDYKARFALEDRVLLFFTGITRNASSVLTEQKANVGAKFEVLKAMSDSVPEFEAKLLAADFPGLGKMLHDGWLQKKSLTSNGSNQVIDNLYIAGLDAGAWGGKLLGAGAGGCVMFLVAPEKRNAVRQAVASVANESGLADFKEIPIHFIQSAAEIIHRDSNESVMFS